MLYVRGVVFVLFATAAVRSLAQALSHTYNISTISLALLFANTTDAKTTERMCDRERNPRHTLNGKRVDSHRTHTHSHIWCRITLSMYVAHIDENVILHAQCFVMLISDCALANPVIRIKHEPHTHQLHSHR